MKVFNKSIILLISGLILTSPSYGDLNQDLELHYSFDNVTGSTVTDDSGNGLTGTVVGTVSTPTGVKGNGFSFNGSTHIDVGNVLGMAGSTTQLTISLWFKIDPSGTPNTRLVTKKIENAPFTGWSIHNLSNGSKLAGSLISTHPEDVEAYTPESIDDGVWHSMVTTFEVGSSSMVSKVYFDGVISTVDVQSGAHDPTDTISSLTVGGLNGANSRYDGELDELRIYSRVLDVAEIEMLASPEDEDLELYYSFDNVTGSTVTDDSGNGLTGAVVGTASTPSGVFGNGFSFDGSTHIDVGDVLGINETNTDLTVSLWFKILPNGTPNTRLITKRIGTHPYTGWSVHNLSNGSKIAGSIVANYPEDAEAYSPEGIDDGEWHALAVTFEVGSSSMVAKVYYDGVLSTIDVQNGPHAPTDVTSGLTVGGRNGAELRFDGELDELKIYSRLLTSNEILEHAEPPDQVSLNDGLGLYYSFDNVIGSSVPDDSGSGLTGTVVGAVSTPTGVYGNGFSFDGSTHIDVGDVLGLSGSSTQLTAAMWFKILPDGTPNTRLVTKRIGASPYTGWSVHNLSNGSKIAGSIIANYPEDAEAYTPEGIDDGNWHALAVTFDVGPSSMVSKVYYDGLLSTVDVQNGSHGATDAISGLTVGGRNGAELRFDGELDELRIYTRLLNINEISELAVAPPPVILDDGLALYYSFDNVVSSTIMDDSGSGLTGTVIGTVSTPAGVFGNGFSFDGSTQIDVGEVLGLTGSTTQLSVSLWYNIPVGASKTDMLISKRFTTPQNGWSLLTLGGQKLAAGVLSPFNVEAETPAGIADGQWHAMCALFDVALTSIQARVYIDGVLSGTRIVNGAHSATDSAALLTVGGRSEGTQLLEGKLDELRIHTRILEESEIIEFAAAPPSVSLEDGQELYYSFDNVTGSTVIDDSGNGLTGTVIGTVSTPAGVFGNGFSFDGSTHIDVGDVLGLSGTTTQLSVCMWYNIPPGANGNTMLASKRFLSPGTGWSVLNLSNGSKLAASLIASSNVETYSQEGIDDGQWHALCALFDVSPTAITVQMYIDGVLTGIQTVSGAHAATDSAASLVVGGRSEGNLLFDGMLDEFRIYNRLLATEEIEELALPENEDLELYYSFDNVTGSTVNDDSGNGLTGTVIGTVSTPLGVLGGGFLFDGSTHIEVGDVLGLNETNSTLTVSFWFNIPPSGSPNTRLVTKRISTYPHTGWSVHNLSNGAKLAGSLVANYPEDAEAYSPQGIDDGEWHAMVSTFEVGPTIMVAKVYVDGVQVSTDVENGAHGPTDLASILTVGGLNGAGLRFDGQLDELKIHSRLLTETEIEMMAQSNPQDPPQDLEPDLYYDFEGVSGLTVEDKSGNGLDGAVTGTVSTPAGILGSGFKFDESTHINVGDVLGLTGTSSQLSVCLWYKIPPGANGNTMLVSKRFLSPGNGWSVLNLSNGSKLAASLIATSNVETYSPEDIDDGQWHALCALFDVSPTAITVQMYIDGVLRGTRTVSGTHAITDTGASLVVGGRSEGTHLFDGTLDELRIYKRLLAVEEIQELASIGSPKSDLLLRFDFEEIKSGKILDLGPNMYDATVINSVSLTSDGVHGNALQLDGNGHLDLGDVLNFDESLTNITVCTWVKNSSASLGQVMSVFSRMEQPMPYTGWDIHTEVAGVLTADIIETYPLRANAVSTNAISDDQWHFVCGQFIRSATNIHTKLYIDGFLQAESEDVGNNLSISNDVSFLIGARDGVSQKFIGCIDELKAFSKLLSDEEMQDLMRLKPDRIHIRPARCYSMDVSSGFIYTLQGRKNPISTNWYDIGNSLVSTGTVMNFYERPSGTHHGDTRRIKCEENTNSGPPYPDPVYITITNKAEFAMAVSWTSFASELFKLECDAFPGFENWQEIPTYIVGGRVVIEYFIKPERPSETFRVINIKEDPLP